MRATLSGIRHWNSHKKEKNSTVSEPFHNSARHFRDVLRSSRIQLRNKNKIIKNKKEKKKKTQKMDRIVFPSPNRSNLINMSSLINKYIADIVISVFSIVI